VFTPERSQADFFSAMVRNWATSRFKTVDPREVVRLDKTVPCPADAFRVSLTARDRDGENRGVLGNVILRPKAVGGFESGRV